MRRSEPDDLGLSKEAKEEVVFDYETMAYYGRLAEEKTESEGAGSEVDEMDDLLRIRLESAPLAGRNANPGNLAYFTPFAGFQDPCSLRT